MHKAKTIIAEHRDAHREPMKPIIFDAQSVRAILDGRKTQTRRAIRPQPEVVTKGFRYAFKKHECKITYTHNEFCAGASDYAPCQPGDILWVRETFCACHYDSGAESLHYVYKADDPGRDIKDCVVGGAWKSPIRMPREAARLFLLVKAARAERLRDISVEDCVAKGCYVPYVCRSESGYIFELVSQYEKLWDELNDKRGYGWDANPWVFVYEFERIEKP